MPPLPSFTKSYHTKPYPSISPTRPEISAKDKIVLITGAGSGIGQATAVAFAQADAKALILCGRRTEPLLETKSKINALNKGSQVLTLELDISDEPRVNEVFATVWRGVGEIDIVINSGGHLGSAENLKDASSENFWRTFEVNVKGSFLISRAFLNHTTPSIKSPKVLLLLSSYLAMFPAHLVRTAIPSYPISKLAVAKLAEYLASENKSPGFRAYAIHPGVVDTEMSQKSIETHEDPQKSIANMVWDDVELPAGFMVWLCSRRAEKVPSGRFLSINWDVDELEERGEELRADAGLLTMGVVGSPFGQ